LQAPAGPSGKTTVLIRTVMPGFLRGRSPGGNPRNYLHSQGAAEHRAAGLCSKRCAAKWMPRVPKGARSCAADAALALPLYEGFGLGRTRAGCESDHRLVHFRLATQLTVTAKAVEHSLFTERAARALQQSARLTLAAADDDPQLAEDVELLFERLDNNWGQRQRLLADMLPSSAVTGCGMWLGHEPGALCARISVRSRRNSTRPSARSLFTSAHCTPY